MSENPFNQFDPQPNVTQGNPFDQFDPNGSDYDIGKSAAIAIPEAGTGFAGIVGDLSNLINQPRKYLVRKGYQYLAGMPEDQARAEVGRDFSDDPTGNTATAFGGLPFPTSKGIQSAAEQVTGPWYEPQTKAGHFVNTGVKLGLMAATPASLAGDARNAAILAGESIPASGVIEGVHNYAPDNPVLNAAAALLSFPLTHGAVSVARGTAGNNAAAMIARRTAQETPESFAAAQRLQEQGLTSGVPLMGPEALDNAELQQLASFAKTQPKAGSILSNFVGQRASRRIDGQEIPGQVESAVRDQLGQIAPDGLTPPNDAASSAVNAATGAIQSAEKARSNAVRPYYDAAKSQNVHPMDVASLIQSIDQSLATTPASMRGPLQALRGDLIKEIPGENGNPIYALETNVGNLDSIYKKYRDAALLPDFAANGIDKETAARMSDSLKQLRLTTSPALGDARAQYGALTDQTVKPLMESPVGTITSQSKDIGQPQFTSVIDSFVNPKTARPETIEQAGSALNSVDPSVMPQLAGNYVANALDSALKDIQSGPSPAVGVKLRNLVAGTPQQRANLDAMLGQVESAHGMEPGKLSSGFNNLLDVLERTGRIPGMGSQTQSRSAMADEAASVGAPYSLLGTAIDAPGKSILSGLKGAAQRKTLEEIANIFTSPDSVQKIRRLSEMNPDSPMARMLAISALQGAGAFNLLNAPGR
jgi:hypothetical protein